MLSALDMQLKARHKKSFYNCSAKAFRFLISIQINNVRTIVSVILLKLFEIGRLRESA